jgi:hypothetical protein
MTIFVPNCGEKEMLESILKSQALRLGLYKTIISEDGALTFDSITGLDVEGGYAVKDLGNDVVRDAPAAGKWFLTTNASGKAEAQYGLTAGPQEWTFTDVNVANVETAYGIYMWTLTLAFTSGGTTEIKVGDTIGNLASNPTATAVVTQVILTGGTWAGGDAAGTLRLKTQVGTFASGSIYVGASEIATIAGDTTKVLFYIERFTAGQLIDMVGQKISYLPKVTLTTA